MTSQLLKSKIFAWSAFALIIVLIGITFTMRPTWWSFCDIFFAFMMVFSHLMAVYLNKFNQYVSKKLDVASLVCGILMIIALIVEWILLSL